MAKKASRGKATAKKRKVINASEGRKGLGVILQGRLLPLNFFKRNAWLILIMVGLVIALIGQRYSNHTKMLEIKQLTKELDRAKSEQLHQKSLYMSTVRENEMIRLLHNKGIDLGYQEQPPYSLSSTEGSMPQSPTQSTDNEKENDETNT